MENRPEPVPVIPVMVIAGAPAVLFRAFTSPPPPGTSSRRSSESLPARTARLRLPGTPPIGPEPRYLRPVGTHRPVASGAGSSGVAISGHGSSLGPCSRNKNCPPGLSTRPISPMAVWHPGCCTASRSHHAVEPTILERQFLGGLHLEIHVESLLSILRRAIHVMPTPGRPQ